ncbi:D-arabinitol 2-dehydrogenase (ribulose-forming) [Beauveria bassiana]|uniref:D-arabinitol 2-dehydrogenase (Ribulose-forming) n=1 Tax=Beauveria bassiana TaxID=176275 RepID=A0A2N6NM44_BEABA|nr:D-arabinitol 2-dehydrogenase (ribulose-forming) [Beauveria bassiana]
MASRLTPTVRTATRRCAAARMCQSLVALRALHDGPPRRNKPGNRFRHRDPLPPEDELPSDPVRRAGGQYVKPTLQTFSLDKKVGLVTGGARGLGLVIAQGMVYSGADVALVDMNSKSTQKLGRSFTSADIPTEEEAEKQTKNLVKAFMRENPNAARVPKVTAHFSDVSDPASVDACIAEVIEQHGKIDNLVTSAGFTENYEAVNYPIDRLRKLWAVNIDGTYLFATSVARHLMERKEPGSMVLIGSMSGSIVNVPQPQTTAKILDENPELKKKWVSLIPMGKMGDPGDLMGPVIFLLSENSKYVNGIDLRVDGGYTLT